MIADRGGGGVGCVVGVGVGVGLGVWGEVLPELWLPRPYADLALLCCSCVERTEPGV